MLIEEMAWYQGDFKIPMTMEMLDVISELYDSIDFESSDESSVAITSYLVSLKTGISHVKVNSYLDTFADNSYVNKISINDKIYFEISNHGIETLKESFSDARKRDNFLVRMGWLGRGFPKTKEIKGKKVYEFDIQPEELLESSPLAKKIREKLP